jgi:hypothetical protein
MFHQTRLRLYLFHGGLERVWLAAVLLSLAAASAYSQSPWAATQMAGPVARTRATLNGMATPRGSSAAAWFEWGADTHYGSATTLTNVGSGGAVVRVSAEVDGLAPGATYHYRLVVTNASGTAVGADNLFNTGTKLATWTDGTTVLPSIPTGLTNIVGLACGHNHSLALTSDGTVVAWAVGFPYYGETNPPAGLSNVVAVAGGWEHSLALRQDGTVAAWGEYMSPAQPAFVPAGLSNVVAIAGGDSHSLALKSDGTVAAWGGQTSTPAHLTNVVAIAAGSTHNLALRADGTVVAWGLEPSGNPTPPPWLSNIVAISTETWHNLALRADGTVVAWGNNAFGQTNVPTGLSNVVAIAAGLRHSLVLKADGTLTAWGAAAYVTNVPSGLSNVVAISSGDNHSMALSGVNLAPRAFSRAATGGLSTDLIIKLPGWDPNGDALGFRITSPPTNGTLYQFTGSGRGDPITNPGTSLSDRSRVVFSPLPNSMGAPYTTFGFVANDGQYDSSPGLITVTILPRPLIQSAGFAQNGDQGFSISFNGLSNAAYAVEVSTNLINWTRLGSASHSSPGQFLFLDAIATNSPYRFYRVISP